jgi:pilus assembly protein CpaB
MRAVGVRVNDIIGVSGFVVPGMRVDVLISGTPPGAGGNIGKESRTLLQNIEVLSAGPNIQQDAEGKPISAPVVNLLVTPDQAEILTLASAETAIQLVLRNPLDKETVKTPGTALASLFSGAKTAQAEAPKPRVARVARRAFAKPAPEKQPWVVEVIQGSGRDSVKFSEESQ